MAYLNKIRKSFWKILLSVILVFLFFSLCDLIFLSGEKVNHCSSVSNVNTSAVKYIFNLEHWRQLMLHDLDKYRKNASAWCGIPPKVHSISQAICQMYGKDNCPLLPCHYIHSSSNTLEDIRCTHDGRIKTSANDESDLLCKRGYSLDLFLKDSSYPSMIADALTPFTDQLYRKTLNNHYRSCDSIWGMRFNFESITHYPWTGERSNLKLFDITFGYDRLIYDFIPHPWLFNYIEELKFTSKRRSIEDVMRRKKFIHSSSSSSNLYWTNTQTVLKIQLKSHSYYFF